jgi:integrase
MPKKKNKYYVRPDGLHETIRKIDGKRVAFRGKSDAEVDKKLLEFERSREEQSHPLFKDVSAEWEEDHIPTLSFNTARNYKTQNKIVTEHFGEYRIDEITPQMIQAYLSSHKTQARKTVTNRLLTLNLIFNFAILHGYITVNPCAAARVPKGLSQQHRRPPTEEETKIIKKYGSDPDGLMPLLILCTGCRKGEAMALLDTDIDHKAKTISITKSVYFDHNRPMLKPPKSDAGYRVTPVPNFLLKLLPKTQKGVPLFPGNHVYMDAGQFERMWTRWQKKTGLDLTAHQIRHGYATILYEAGIQAKDAQLYLGHAQLSTTMDIYTHIRQNHRAATDKKINSAFNNI